MTIDGTYKACLIKKSPEATSKKYGKIVLKVKNNKLQGSMFPLSFWLNGDFRGGQINNNKFEFLVSFATPCQQYSMTVKGEVNDEKITGTAFTPMGEYLLEGVRI